MKRIKFVKSILVAIVAFPFMSFDFLNKKDCYTDADVEGPFFRDGAPSRINLADSYTGKGVSLIVKGYVYGNDCQTPIKNAQIDIWHASPDGQYDLNSDKYMFRGKLFTDKKGFYQFKTLMPKGYKDGGLDRPKHIHYRVSSDAHKMLITQLYFKGDEKLKNDPFVIQNNGFKRAKTLQEITTGDFEMTFNINLKPK